MSQNNSQKKIFMFSSVHRWDDIRIMHKEAISLSKIHQVELHIPAPFNYRKIGSLLIFGLPEWKKKIERIKIHFILLLRIIKSDADIFHYHDPELIFIGLFIKLFLHKKVIYDIHEDYPKILINSLWLPWFVRRILSVGIKYLQYFAFQSHDYYIVVTPFIREKFVHSKIEIIYNYPKIKSFATTKKETNKFLFVYMGDMREDRGIRNMCEAFRQIEIKNVNYKYYLHIAGKLSGNSKFNEEMLKLFDHPQIRYHGLVPNEKALQIMSISHVGIIPYLPVINYFNALPNKLFEYMASSLAVIASNFPVWESIIINNRIGYTFESESVVSIKLQMEYCIKHREEILLKGFKAHNIVLDKFNWRSEESKLYSIYKSIE